MTVDASPPTRSGREHGDVPGAARIEGTLKVVIVGESGVGKTSLASRYAYGVDASGRPEATVGVDLFSVVYRFGDGLRRVRVVFWDTAGQERFRATTAAFYRGAHAYIVVGAVDDAGNGAPRAPEYARYFDEIVANRSYDDALVACALNKIDVLPADAGGGDERRRALVTRDAVLDAWSAAGTLDFVRSHVTGVSARDGTNVDELFESTIEAVLARRGLWMGTSSAERQTVQLEAFDRARRAGPRAGAPAFMTSALGAPECRC